MFLQLIECRNVIVRPNNFEYQIKNKILETDFPPSNLGFHSI